MEHALSPLCAQTGRHPKTEPEPVQPLFPLFPASLTNDAPCCQPPLSHPICSDDNEEKGQRDTIIIGATPSAASGQSNLTVYTPTSSMLSFSRRASDCESGFTAVSQMLGAPSTGDFDASRGWAAQELESFFFIAACPGFGLAPQHNKQTIEASSASSPSPAATGRRRTLSEAFGDDNGPQSYHAGSTYDDRAYSYRWPRWA